MMKTFKFDIKSFNLDAGVSKELFKSRERILSLNKIFRPRIGEIKKA